MALTQNDPGAVTPESASPPRGDDMTTTIADRKNNTAYSDNTSIELETLPKIRFNGYLWKLAKQVAKLRDTVYDGFGGGQVHGDQSSSDANLTGAMGELAVATFFDCLHPESVNIIHPYGDPGWDFKTPNGTIDVKATSTHLAEPDLIVPATDSSTKADIYILTHRISNQTMRIIGMATRRQVKSKTPERKPGSRLNHVVPMTELQLFQRGN